MTDKDFLIKNKRYYKEIEDYDWVRVTDNFVGIEAIFHRLRERIIKNLVKEFGRGSRYLDAGCGTGLILRDLPNGAVGIDINPRNIERAKKHAPLAQTIEADIENIPFKDNSFSTVICTEVLEHQPYPQVALREIKRVLNPGGIVIGSVPSKSPIWKLRFLSSTCPRSEPYHKNYSISEIKNLLVNNDFKIIKIGLASLGMSIIFVVENEK